MGHWPESLDNGGTEQPLPRSVVADCAFRRAHMPRPKRADRSPPGRFLASPQRPGARARPRVSTGAERRGTSASRPTPLRFTLPGQLSGRRRSLRKATFYLGGVKWQML